jgi:hypothetical protein
MFVQDPGSEFFFHPGYEFFPSRIRITKNLSILTQKIVSKLSEIWSGLFPDPDFIPIPIPDPGVKKAPDPGSWSATLVPGNSSTSIWRKTHSLLLHAFHSLFNLWILHEAILYPGFQIPNIKIRVTRNPESIHESRSRLEPTDQDLVGTDAIRSINTAVNHRLNRRMFELGYGRTGIKTENYMHFHLADFKIIKEK